MPQSLSNVLILTAFSTKNRTPYLKDPTLRKETHNYIARTTKTLDRFPIQIGGIADHVHLLTKLSRTLTIADFIKETKCITTS